MIRKGLYLPLDSWIILKDLFMELVWSMLIATQYIISSSLNLSNHVKKLEMYFTRIFWGIHIVGAWVTIGNISNIKLNICNYAITRIHWWYWIVFGELDYRKAFRSNLVIIIMAIIVPCYYSELDIMMSSHLLLIK